tara:strand:+ start:231 stop:734 length:504 start_codon:yes stop_codon:yes gene_type:complete
MSLKDKISLYDTNGNLGESGRSVDQTTAGDFQQDNFKGSEDHLKDLLSKRLKSNSTGQVYPNNAYFRPSPQDSDMEGVDGGNGYFHEKPNPGKYDGKQIDGVDLHEHLLTQTYQYNHGANTPGLVGPAPGPTGNSTYQDMDGLDFGGNYNNGRYSNPDTGQTYETQG